MTRDTLFLAGRGNEGFAQALTAPWRRRRGGPDRNPRRQTYLRLLSPVVGRAINLIATLAKTEFSTIPAAVQAAPALAGWIAAEIQKALNGSRHSPNASERHGKSWKKTGTEILLCPSNYPVLRAIRIARRPEATRSRYGVAPYDALVGEINNRCVSRLTTLAGSPGYLAASLPLAVCRGENGRERTTAADPCISAAVRRLTIRWSSGPMGRHSRSLAEAHPRKTDKPQQLGLGSVTSLLAVATLSALCYPLLSMGLTYAPPLQFATFRAGLAGLALGLLAVVLRRPFPKGRSVWPFVILSGFFTTTIGFLSMFGAARLVAPGIATVVAGTQPIMAGLIAMAVFGQPFGKWQILGMCVSLSGIYAMVSQDITAGGTTAIVGSALVITATFGTAFGNALTKRFAADVDPVAAASLQLLFGVIPLAVLAYFFEPWTPRIMEPEFLMILILLAIGGTAVSFTLWIGILKHCPLNTANAFTLLTPLLGVAISLVLFGQRLGPLTMFGMALTVAGIVLAARGE